MSDSTIIFQKEVEPVIIHEGFAIGDAGIVNLKKINFVLFEKCKLSENKHCATLYFDKYRLEIENPNYLSREEFQSKISSTFEQTWK